MKFRAVVFDLDGTLVDTIEDLAEAMNSVLEQCSLPVHEVEAYKYFVGNGMDNLVRRALPEKQRGDEAFVTGSLSSMREEYARRWKDKSRPYEGIEELLDGLVGRGIKMAVLSNKPDELAKVMVAELLTRWHFEAVAGESPLMPRKPDPAGALQIARRLGLPPAEFLYVGDSATDMLTANGAGMYAVGALWGFRKADELLAAGAKVLVAKPEEILSLM